MCINLCIYLYICLCLCVCVCLSVCLIVCLSVSVCLYVSLSVCLSVCLLQRGPAANVVRSLHIQRGAESVGPRWFPQDSERRQRRGGANVRSLGERSCESVRLDLCDTPKYLLSFFWCIYWWYVYIALVIVLWHPPLSLSSLSSSASVTALRWEPVNIHV